MSPFDRIPVLISFVEQVKMVETYGFSGSQGKTILEGQRLAPKDKPSDTVFLFMHPASTLHLLPMPVALAEAGLHVLCAASRYMKNDSPLIMEKVVVDLGQTIRHAKQELGYRKVILVGWSGGGSLSLFYQGQAERPSITHTPAGDPYDLTAAGLTPADGVIFIAAHLSRAETLTEWLDPSMRDELAPDRRDLELDIYDKACPDQPPYTKEFIARFRAAQVARNRRITDWALELLETLKQKNDGEMERAFVVHRTMCDVRWMTRRWTRTAASPTGATSATRASSTSVRSAWAASAPCARGCRSGPTTSPTPRGRSTQRAFTRRRCCRS